MPHFHQLMAFQPKEPQDFSFIGQSPLKLRSNPVPPVVRAWNDREHLQILPLFQVKQRISYTFFFQLQLMAITDMLVLAAAAFPE